MKDLNDIINDVLENTYPNKVNNYKLGKKGLIGLFVGEVMIKTENKIDPELIMKIIKSKIG